MLKTSITFFIIAMITYLSGAYEITGFSFHIGRILFIFCLAFSIIAFLAFVTNDNNHKKLR